MRNTSTNLSKRTRKETRNLRKLSLRVVVIHLVHLLAARVRVNLIQAMMKVHKKQKENRAKKNQNRLESDDMRKD